MAHKTDEQKLIEWHVAQAMPAWVPVTHHHSDWTPPQQPGVTVTVTNLEDWTPQPQPQRPFVGATMNTRTDVEPYEYRIQRECTADRTTLMQG